MSTSELERLLWERIDGTIEAADLERLDTMLESEAGAQRLEAEIADLAGRLDATGDIEAPADLGDDIRSALRAAPSPAFAAGADAAGSSGGWRAGLGRILGPQPTRRLVMVAAGLVLAVVGFRLVTSPTGSDDGQFVGTAGLTETDSAVSTVRLELPDARGLLTISRYDERLELALDAAPSLGRARLQIQGSGLAIAEIGGSGDAAFEILDSARGVELDVIGTGLVELTVAGAVGGGATVAVVADGVTLAYHEIPREARPSE